jgi:NDP-sugar pyrophosphorylase family protein
MKTDKAIIMCAGMSSRMKQVRLDAELSDELSQQAQQLPKSMIGLGPSGEPFLIYLMKMYVEAGVKEFCLVLNEKDKYTANFFMEHGFSFLRDCTIHFVQQKIPAGRKKPLGTAQALQVGLEAVPFWSGHAFLVSNGDNLYDSTEIATLANSPHPNAMVAYHAHDVHPDQSRISNYALLKIEQDCLKDIVEKPDENIRSNWGEPWVSMNIWKLDYDTVLPVLRKTPMNLQRQEHELPTSMRMLAQKTDIFCYYSNASVPDLTSQQDIKRVQEIVHPIDL